MKLGIVIPLKAKAVAKNWQLTCKNLELTVTSLLNQSSSDFYAVVVGHDMPDFMSPDRSTNPELCRFATFDELPPPQTDQNEQENQLKYERDRCSKILKGLIVLSNLHPDITHWFPLDADDLIHRDFVKTLSALDNADAYILENGYSFYKSAGMINEENQFSAYCGSSAVLSKALVTIPADVTADSFRKMAYGNTSHVHMRSFLEGKGYKIVVPEERIIMYVRDNGENISNSAYYKSPLQKTKKFIKMLLKVKISDKAIKQNFCIQN